MKRDRFSKNAVVLLAVLLLSNAMLIGLFNGFLIEANAETHISKISVLGGSTYERFYDDAGNFVRQVETYDEGDTKVARTSGATGQILEIRRVTETPDINDSTTINREIITKRYPPGSRVPYETEVFREQEVLISLAERLPRTREITTKIYSKTKPRKLIKTVVETGKLVMIDEAGVPIFEGKRTTTTADGVLTEELDRETQQWKETQDQPIDDSAKGELESPEDECSSITKNLSELIAEEQELLDLKDDLSSEIGETLRNIDRAKAWQGLPTQFQLVERTDRETGESFWECPVCEGPEESVLNRLHAFACVPGGNSVFHPQVLPADVEAFRFVYEISARTDRQTLLDATGFCGKGISPLGQIIYTDWSLRDAYLEVQEPALDRKIDELNSIVDQLLKARQLVLNEREVQKINCENSSRPVPSLFLPTRPQNEETEPNCIQPGLIGGVNCVDELLGK